MPRPPPSLTSRRPPVSRRRKAPETCPGCGRVPGSCECLVPSDDRRLGRCRADWFLDLRPPLVLEELDGGILVTLQPWEHEGATYRVAIHPSDRTTAAQMRAAGGRALDWHDWIARMLGEAPGIIEQVQEWLAQEMTWAEIAEMLNLHLAVYVELGMHDAAVDLLKTFQPRANTHAAIRQVEENRDDRAFLKENPLDGDTVKKRLHRIGQ